MKKITRFKLESTLTIWFPILIAIFFWNKIPNRLPTHLNSQMIADSWSSKTAALITLPIVLTATQLFLILVVSRNSKNGNVQPWIQRIILSIMPVLSAMIFLLMILNATRTFPIFLQNNYLNILFGIISIVLGLISGRVKPNYAIGIKTPWTLHSEKNWQMTHKLGEKVYIAGGIIMIIVTSVMTRFFFIPVLIITALIPCIYSYLLHKKGI